MFESYIFASVFPPQIYPISSKIIKDFILKFHWIETDKYCNKTINIINIQLILLLAEIEFALIMF